MMLYWLVTTLVLIAAAEVYGYSCVVDTDCLAFTELNNVPCVETECPAKHCFCPVGQRVYSENTTGILKYHCVPLIPAGQPCTNNLLSGTCNTDRELTCISNICQCAATWKLYSYTHWHLGHEEICQQGLQYPEGEIRHIGSRCSNDSDCSYFNNVTCVNNTCTCATPGHVPDINGIQCRFPLQHGANCTTGPQATEQCDGTKGLVCGDICNSTASVTCQCDHSYIESGSNCIRATVGSSCSRDNQCKSLSRLATCQSGSCAIAPGTGCLGDQDCHYVSPTAVCVGGACQTGSGSGESSSSTQPPSGLTTALCSGRPCESGAAGMWMDVFLIMGLIMVKLFC